MNFWEKVMLGKKTCSEMSDFWAYAKTHACIQDCCAGAPDRVLPLAVHGDEVPVVGRGKEALVVSWYSTWATHLNMKVALQKICAAFEAKAEALYWQVSSFTNKNGDKKHRSRPLHARRTAVEPVCADRNGSNMEGPGIECPGHVEAQGCDDSLTARPPKKRARGCHR